jgi:hypothetical protein
LKISICNELCNGNPNILFLDPFLTGDRKTEQERLLPDDRFLTEYDINFYRRPNSPRGPIRRPTNLRLSKGSMDIFSEQKSKYIPYSDAVYAKSRPPMIKYPNNLKLSGDIELLPEYKKAYVPYDLNIVQRINNFDDPPYLQRRQVMEARKKERPVEARNGVQCKNRYHEKQDDENNYQPEYTRQFLPIQVERSKSIPQASHFVQNKEPFDGTSEYNTRYKYYDHFSKSAPIKKLDNLSLKGQYDIRPEYNEQYKTHDSRDYQKRVPLKQQDNLNMQGEFPRQVPEYHESFKDHHIKTLPERAKPKKDYLYLNGDMEYSPEYRDTYRDFPRQRPIIKKPQSNIKLSSNRSFEEEGPHERVKYSDEINGATLPVNVQNYHNDGLTPHHRMKSEDANGDLDDEDLKCNPEYRKAYKNYLLKERSPSRINLIEDAKHKNDKEPKRFVSEENLKDGNNKEAIVETIKPPADFKIPTRSPTHHSAGRAPSYPIENEKGFKPKSPIRSPSQRLSRDSRGRRLENGGDKVLVEEYDRRRRDFPVEEFTQKYDSQPSYRRVPRYGRRSNAPVAVPNNNYIRTRTNVIEANPNYIREPPRDVKPNRHEQSAYFQSHQPNYPAPACMPIKYPDLPESSLGNANYLGMYEYEKQQQYRQHLGGDKPFVVIDKGQKNAPHQETCKPNKWMQPSWYDP